LTLIFASRKEPVIYVWNYFNEHSSVGKIGLNGSSGKIISHLILTNSYILIQFSSWKYVLLTMESDLYIERSAYSNSHLKVDYIQSKALVGSGNSTKLLNFLDPQNITEEQQKFPNEYISEVSCISFANDGIIG
jgi:hypothetical protein